MKRFFAGCFVALSSLCLPSFAQTTEPIHPTGSFYALIIGESQYDNTKLTLDRPAKDAAKFKDVLLSKYTFDEKNVKLLLNATRKQIIAELYNLRKIITTNDNLVIFYAGHGFWDDQSQQGYWWPRDASIDEPSNWLSNSDLKEQIRGIKTAHTLLISDACFSGGIFKTRGAAELIRNSSLNIQMQYKMPSRRAMTSGTLTTVPDESVFFTYLIKRLAENKEKFLPSEDLFSSLKQAVINNSMVVPQDGVIADSGDEGGDFIFILKDNSLSTSTSTTKVIAATATRGGAVNSADDLLESGKDLFNTKKYKEAYDCFTKVIALDSQKYEAYIFRGRTSNNQHNYEAAAVDFSMAIKTNPNLAWGYCLRGMVKNEMRRYARAILDLNKAIEINPRYSNAYNFRGFANMELRKYEEAMNDFTETIRIDSKFVYAWENRGFLKCRMEKFEEAITDLSKAIEIKPEYALAYCDRGFAKLKLGNAEEALADISKAIALDPKLPRAYNNRGLYYVKLDKPDLALEDFTTATDLDPAYLFAKLNRAQVFYSMKDYKNALSDLEVILQASPNYQEALALKAKIEAEK